MPYCKRYNAIVHRDTCLDECEYGRGNGCTYGEKELRKSNGDYTEEGLEYPGMKADIDLCYKYLHELCQIVWGNGRDGYKPKMTMWSIPPQPDNFDMQISAALDELKAYRECGLLPNEVEEMKYRIESLEK